MPRDTNEASDSKFKVERGVPQPTGYEIYHQYPFSEMNIGDSFAGEVPDTQLVRNAACNYANKHGGKFTVRTVDGGFRCWRIA
jgi:hypothetical protein